MPDVFEKPKSLSSLELLAPAGDFEALEAALEAGAGAVYFGLTSLNARRGARNFRQEEVARAVEAVHARGVRAYLTLNIDLTQRELGQAARILELARQNGVDAVLVRDPALFALHRAYPELEFHFSTQTCMTNSADVAAARHLGAARVVLARELALDEIAAASKVRGIETEVFVQGALCFCISGRCLLSSWVGGRSGNRGTCTSPCRVPWTAGEQAAGTLFSMRDLAAIQRLAELRQAGVRGLKIEGRLKTAAWVRQAVSLYRRALEGDDPQRLLDEVQALGAYTGRALTSAYLDGDRTELTGESGRPVSAMPQEPEKAVPLSEPEQPPDVDGPTYEFDMTVTPRAVQCRVVAEGRTAEWTIPKTVVRRVRKAVTIGQFLAWLDTQTIRGCRPTRTETNDPDFLIVPRAVNALLDRISAEIRLAHKAPDRHVRIALPERVSEMIAPARPASANRMTLGEEPDRVRLEAGQALAFLKQVQVQGVVVEGTDIQALERIIAGGHRAQIVAALPQVFFEREIPSVKKLLGFCVRANMSVEVNSWGGWHLAREARVRMESGPGMPVLNALAARRLREAGIECVTLSVEADRKQLEDVSACCPVPCSLAVFGRPPLLTTRVQLAKDQFLGKTIEDRRGVRLTGRPERGLWVFRPVDPFDLRATQNDRIRVRHLVVDLVGSPNPLDDWFNVPFDNKRTFRFNYDRSLK
jgi:collagenase-like PrtC family protease